LKLLALSKYTRTETLKNIFYCYVGQTQFAITNSQFNYNRSYKLPDVQLNMYIEKKFFKLIEAETKKENFYQLSKAVFAYCVECKN